jgi:hypothetical protein
MAKFKAGDKVWVRTSEGHTTLPRATEVPGVIVDILGYPLKPWWGLCYTVEIAGDAGWGCAEEHLRPRDDPPSKVVREEVGEWDLCPWRPQKVVAE